MDDRLRETARGLAHEHCAAGDPLGWFRALLLLTAVACCSTTDDPALAALRAERERLREAREQVEVVPPDLAASESRLAARTTRLPATGVVGETTVAVGDAIHACGGNVNQLTPPRVTHALGVERHVVTVTFNGLSLAVAVCAVGSMIRGAHLLLVDSFECTRPRNAVACTLTVHSARLDDSLPAEEPPALPPGASEEVRNLHAEVVTLWEETRAAREVLARARVLEAQLEAAQRLEFEHERNAHLAGLADDVARTGCEPDRFAFDGDTLSFSGSAPSSTARTQLAAVRSREHAAIQLGEVSVNRRLAPVDIASLPRIPPVGKRRRQRVLIRVHAADAEAMWLYSALAEDEPVVSTTVRGQLVTGRLEASSARDARRALRADQPGLAIHAVKKRALRGRASPVTHHVTGGRTSQLFDMLGNTIGVSIAAPVDLPYVTVAVRNTAADGVVQALAGMLDLAVDRRPGVWLLTRASARMPRGRGPRVDLSAVGLTAAQTMALLDAIAPTGIPVPCEAPPIEVWLEGVAHGDAARAVLVSADLPWPAPGSAGCKIDLPDLVLPPVELVGLAFSKTGGVAIARNGAGVLGLVRDRASLADGTELLVTRAGLTATRPTGENTSLTLRKSWAARNPTVLRGSRLAATVVRDRGTAEAVLERSNGDWILLRAGLFEPAAAQVAIAAGRVAIAPQGGEPYSLALRRRLSH